MKLAVKPKQMKLLLAGAGALGYLLRTTLYASGIDEKGLLISGHWAEIGVWILTATVAFALLLWRRSFAAPANYEDTSSWLRAVGAALAAVAFAVSPSAQFPNPVFATIEPVLRIAAAGALALVATCHFLKKRPTFLLHCVVCLYLALRLICQYQLWSVEPQIQHYAFHLGAYVSLLITVYQLASFDADWGSLRNLWTAGLSTVYLSTVSLAHNEESFFLICCTLCVFSNLVSSTPKGHPDNIFTQEDPL